MKVYSGMEQVKISDYLNRLLHEVLGFSSHNSEIRCLSATKHEITKEYKIPVINLLFIHF